MIRLAQRMSGVEGQPMFSLLERARAMERSGRHMIHFELGDTDFKTPNEVKAAAKKAIYGDKTHYVSPSGTYELKMAAIKVTERSRGFSPTLDQLLVTPGANMQIYLALAVICDPQDVVAIPVPYFPSYVAQAKSLGLFISYYKDISDLISISENRWKPKAIILNSPSNPTGKVLSYKDILVICDYAHAKGIAIISDEVYSRMIYKGEFVSPSYYDQCKRNVIVINGFSKSFAMSGWRLGVVTGPEAVIKKCTVLLETILSCVPPFIQAAGAKALLGMQRERKRMFNKLLKRRNMMWRGLNGIRGISCEEPEGGLYCWADIRGTGLSSQELCNKAMEAGVVLSPGIFFGVEGYIRLCYGCNDKDIEEGLRRLKAAI